MIRAVVLLCFLIAAFANAGPASQTLSASVKDTQVNGLEGLNLKWSAPFKVQDYVVGFKYSLGDFKKVPDSLFANRSFNTVEGVADVEADYNVAGRVLEVAAKWTSDKLGLSVAATGNSRDRVTEVSASTNQDIRGNKVTLSGTWDRLKNKLDFSTRANLENNLAAQVDYDTVDRNPVLSVSYKVDDKNTVTPAVSLKDGDMSYRWNRKINGGALDAKFHPGDNLEVEWSDNGSNGVWSTKANIPVNNQAGTKISFSREWNY